MSDNYDDWYNGMNATQRAGLAKAYEEEPEKSEKQERSGGGGFGFIFAMLFIGFVIYFLFTFLPPQLDESYAGQGQVIEMVNPEGDDPQRDLQYSEVNQGNAKANETNSRAEQRRSSVWIILILTLGFLAMIFMIAKSITPTK